MSWNIEGKTVVITGATSGIGLEAARQLAGKGARIVLVARNAEKAAATRDAILALGSATSCDIVMGDLSLMADVRTVAAELLERYPRIDVLINNAGLYLADRVETSEGFETTFAVNHMAPFLLTRLLWDRLVETGSARVINVTSGAHFAGRLRWDDLQGAKRYSPIGAYSAAKLANVMFTYELVRQTGRSGVTVNCLHPGMVATNFAQDRGGLLGILAAVFAAFLLSPAKGAATTVHLAVSPDVADMTASYFYRERRRRSSKASRSIEDARRLWNVTSEMVGLSPVMTPASPSASG